MLETKLSQLHMRIGQFKLSDKTRLQKEFTKKIIEELITITEVPS